MMNRIRIGKQQEFAMSDLGKLMASPWFADPIGWQWAAPNQSELSSWIGRESKLLHQVSGTIVGLIVQNDAFKMGIVLSKQGLQTGADALGFVSGGDQDRHQRTFFWNRSGAKPHQDRQIS